MNRFTGYGIHYPLGAGDTVTGDGLRLPPTAKRVLNPAHLLRPVAELRGVGKTTQRRLAGLGIETVGDLLLHLPFRHESPAHMVTVAALPIGEEVTLRVQVVSCAVRQTLKRRVKVLEALVSDHTGSVLAVWYNQSYLETPFRERPDVLLRGTFVRRRGTAVFLVKRHEILGDGGEGCHILGLVPVYPSTADLSVRTIRNLLHGARPWACHLTDSLPARLLAERRYPGRAEAVLASHFPADRRDAVCSRSRMAFEELLLLQMAILRRRRHQDAQMRAHPVSPPGRLSRAFLAALPYRPTKAQTRVIAEIEGDLVRETPMRRLLHGDVGSGKTMVATYCMLRAVEHGGQAALMAPTEILAEQHYAGLCDQLAPLGVQVRLLKGSRPTRERNALLQELSSGEAHLVVGTHALIQEGVAIRDLRLAVVDEQHRFGVRQRDAILTTTTRHWPHTLHMSATPIPRTLSLTLYGDLDVSTLDEMPPGRTPVRTRLVFPDAQPRMWEFVRRQLARGRQAYVVCPLIEESDSLQTASARETAAELASGELAGFRLRLLHGQLSPGEKSATMAAYAGGEVDVLVSTTVIEVGIDVANATVMVILGARHFGLSQLHQLRGRVGRGEGDSYCFLPVEEDDDAVRERLAVFARTDDGFALAEADLAARGEGQLFGDRQSGLGDLRVASLLRDKALLEEARKVAISVCAETRWPVDRVRTHEAIWGPLIVAAEERFGARVDWVDRV